jgi:biopolymer transport protein TolQ
MNQDLSIVHLLLNASWIVQFVVVLLLSVSVASWAIIFGKSASLRRLRSHNSDFERDFWSGASLNDLYNQAQQAEGQGGSLQRVFSAGMREFLKLRERRVQDPVVLLEGAQRAMRVSNQREIDQLETFLPFLGSVASVSPYVGLFGTVWGIMHAFTGLAALQNVTLATVAPGIAEALVATAIGLFAAIPAVLAFNRFSAQIDRMSNHMDTFMDEFSNILQRNLNAQSAAK